MPGGIETTGSVTRLLELLRAQGYEVSTTVFGHEGELVSNAVDVKTCHEHLVHDAWTLRESLRGLGVELTPLRDGGGPGVPRLLAQYDPADDSALLLLTGVDDTMLREGDKA